VEYGFYKEMLISMTKAGKKGAEEIAAMMASFRENPPKSLGGQRVVTVKDYELSTETDLLTGARTPIDLPKSNVLQLLTDGGCIISARPSGTEPKIKFYISVNTRLGSVAEYEAKSAVLDGLIGDIERDLHGGAD